ncbi:hypothetical protein, partial [Streptomyces sp. NRRL S-15]|uniref:hypothetical protein n=1 Tax=Streptomyces sp. NRRL S-15 TaxID=1463886 RepID=UPI003B63B2CB
MITPADPPTLSVRRTGAEPLGLDSGPLQHFDGAAPRIRDQRRQQIEPIGVELPAQQRSAAGTVQCRHRRGRPPLTLSLIHISER